MKRIVCIFIFVMMALLMSTRLFAEPPHHQFEYGAGEPRDKNSFSVKSWIGIFDISSSFVSSNDSVTHLRKLEQELTDNFWAAGIKFTDISVFPSARTGIGKWISAGIDIFTLNGGYFVQATSADGLSLQRSQLKSQTLAVAGHLKVSPFMDSSFQPYIGFGGGPAYTNLKDTRTTIINGGSQLLEHDRKWDTSNLGMAFGGIDVYLGRSFYLNIESQWFGLSNRHLLFPNPDTNRHTTEVKTVLQGWLSSFGIGLAF